VLSVEITMESEQDDVTILQEAEKRLRRLSPERLRVVSDFLAYLEEREENEATTELLNVPGFEQALREAMQEAEAGEVVSFDSIRRHV
jgi:PHD/YefM family antitoxin component YafN of YafNO toxin-antitoxin module